MSSVLKQNKTAIMAVIMVINIRERWIQQKISSCIILCLIIVTSIYKSRVMQNDWEVHRLQNATNTKQSGFVQFSFKWSLKSACNVLKMLRNAGNAKATHHNTKLVYIPSLTNLPPSFYLLFCLLYLDTSCKKVRLEILWRHNIKNDLT